MTQTRHRSYPRPWVVGVTCLFAFCVTVATFIILRMRMYEAGEASPPVWSAAVLALLLGGIFLCLYAESRRLKRKAHEQEMKDDTSAD